MAAEPAATSADERLPLLGEVLLAEPRRQIAEERGLGRDLATHAELIEKSQSPLDVAVGGLEIPVASRRARRGSTRPVR